MVTIVNNLPRFASKAKTYQNDALREGARDIIVLAKNRAPFLTGGLRSDSDTKMVSMLHWRVSFWKEYARFQEFGGTSSRRVRNYTTAGTGKGFLKGSGDAIAKIIASKFRKHGGRI